MSKFNTIYICFYFSFDSNNIMELSKLQFCLTDVKNWLSQNFTYLNQKLLSLFLTLPLITFSLLGLFVLVIYCRNQDVIFDNKFSFDWVVQSYFLHLCTFQVLYEYSYYYSNYYFSFAAQLVRNTRHRHSPLRTK